MLGSSKDYRFEQFDEPNGRHVGHLKSRCTKMIIKSTYSTATR